MHTVTESEIPDVFTRNLKQFLREENIEISKFIRDGPFSNTIARNMVTGRHMPTLNEVKLIVRQYRIDGDRLLKGIDAGRLKPL